MALYVSNDHQLFRRALAASLALHLVLALFLPNWIHAQAPGLQPVESLSFAHLIRLQIESPVKRAPAHALPQTRTIAKTVTFARVHTEISAHTNKPAVPRREIVGPRAMQAAAPRHAPKVATLYSQTQAIPKPVAAAQQNAPATPEPAAVGGSRSVSGENSDRGGVLPLGADQDPVLDPRVIATLQEKLGSQHVTLRVTVGEDGRTQQVVFDPQIDPQIERAVEAILADADWDAAVCGGGVSCEGVATIKL